MRKGVADLHRRAEVSQAANNRYLQTLATVQNPETFADTVAPICRRVRWHNRSVRALNPLAEDDSLLLESVSRGEFALNGFRNSDIRKLLYKQTDPSTTEIKKHSAAVTRKLQLLRAHGLIQKVPKTQRYTVTPKGANIITSIQSARRSAATNHSQLSV